MAPYICMYVPHYTPYRQRKTAAQNSDMLLNVQAYHVFYAKCSLLIITFKTTPCVEALFLSLYLNLVLWKR